MKAFPAKKVSNFRFVFKKDWKRFDVVGDNIENKHKKLNAEINFSFLCL